jgi:predicted CopG family antitoxin
MVKTIAVSKATYSELLKIKEESGKSSMDEALNALMDDYKKLLKQLSIKGLFAINLKENNISVKELLDDRRRYGWARKLY